jgi:DNA-3-methyladenine glycosylase
VINQNSRERMTPRLPVSFFDRHHIDVARDMIGCTLVWDGTAGVIVETEAYAADNDPACHTATRPSSRAFFDSRGPGTVYAYINYGVHWLLNVLAADGIVLFRALEPTIGIALMQERRTVGERTQLCSGPGKLGAAIGLTAAAHGSLLLTAERHVQPRAGDFDESLIDVDVRVGLSVGLDRPWRFLLRGNPHVSVAAGHAASRSRKRSQPE